MTFFHKNSYIYKKFISTSPLEKSTKSFDYLSSEEIQLGCRKSKDFKNHPIIIAGHDSAVNIINNKIGPLGGDFGCPNINCRFEAIKYIKNTPKHYQSDVFLGYHIKYHQLSQFKVCNNQQFAYYSW